MKITRVEPILVRTPLKLDDAQPHAGGVPKNDVHTVLVKVETDEGLTGWGEAFSNAGWQSTCTAVAQIIAPRVVGRDPSQIAQIQADLHRGLYNTGRSGPTVFAISGLDIALWDIAAKRAGLPLYKMLGGSARATLPAYASLLRYGDANVVARKTKEAIDRGYRYRARRQERVRRQGGADGGLLMPVDGGRVDCRGARMGRHEARVDRRADLSAR
jgi:L-alanine-DL-glutamate epimerase-like enolase superfamily enzyme